MSRFCPILGRRVVYLTCTECDDKVCEKQLRSKYKRGDIVYVFGDAAAAGSEQCGGRPAIVVSNDKNNAYSSVVEVVFLTTADKKQIPTHVHIESARHPSTALCEEPTPVSVDRIRFFCGKCTQKEMSEINRALRIEFDL